jgi:hypothetical protein
LGGGPSESWWRRLPWQCWMAGVWRQCARLASLWWDKLVVRLGSFVLAGYAGRGFPSGVPMVYCLQSWRPSGGEVVWGLPGLVSNKGGCPRVPTRAKRMSYRIRVTIDLAKVSRSRRLHRRTPLNDSCLEIAGSGGIRSCAPMFFLWQFGFRGSTSKFRWLLISGGMFSFHGVGGEYHGSRYLWTSDGDLSLVGDVELAW